MTNYSDQDVRDAYEALDALDDGDLADVLKRVMPERPGPPRLTDVIDKLRSVYDDTGHVGLDEAVEMIEEIITATSTSIRIGGSLDDIPETPENVSTWVIPDEAKIYPRTLTTLADYTNAPNGTIVPFIDSFPGTYCKTRMGWLQTGAQRAHSDSDMADRTRPVLRWGLTRE